MSRPLPFRALLKGGALAALAASLAACSGHGSMAVIPPPPPPDAFAAFGANFATDFADGKVSATTLPVTPASGDIVALSLTTQPMTIPTVN